MVNLIGKLIDQVVRKVVEVFVIFITIYMWDTSIVMYAQSLFWSDTPHCSGLTLAQLSGITLQDHLWCQGLDQVGCVQSMHSTHFTIIIPIVYISIL